MSEQDKAAQVRKPTVEQVEDAVGYSYGAWDMVAPEDLIAAVIRLSAPVTPAAEQEKAATVTLTGNQLRAALDFINPDGPADEGQCSDDLTFGIVQHKDDGGKVETSMCCWNDDTDGVFPLPDEYVPAATLPAQDARNLDCYDAGLLSDYGGGNVSWWQDYIRSELGRAHEFYQSQVADLSQQDSGDAEDAARIDWLQEEVVDTIYMDDHTIINVRGLDVRAAIDAARQPSDSKEA